VNRACKRALVLMLVVGCFILVGPSISAQARELFHTYLTEDGSGIAVRPAPADYARMWGEIDSLPKYDPNARSGFQVDLRSRDLTKLDIKDRLADLQHADFDSGTKWPAQLPDGFNPSLAMELGKNPGLGLRELHRTGITGKGVGIGIVDQALLVDHVEYKDRVKLYEEIHDVDEFASMHGPAMASIAVGKTVGAAPEADLYFVADTFATIDLAAGAGASNQWHIDYTWLAKSLDRLLEVNRSLPEDRKIRVIAIARGWMPGETGYQAITEAVKRAGEEGVFVVSSNLQQTHGWLFHGLGRTPADDPDPATSYGEAGWSPPGLTGALLIPMDSRCTAGPNGVEDYAFYRHGGWSWAIPYIAGLYALACQVKPDITPELFWAKALETGDVPPAMLPRVPLSRETERANSGPGKIVNPTRLIASLQTTS